MTKFSKYIGLDVHKETIAVAVADGVGGEPRCSAAMPSTLRRWILKPAA